MNILIIDNSVDFTGAFKCALNEAELLSSTHTFTFVIPSKSKLGSQLSDKGFKVYTLPMIEIRKSISALLLYLPALFVNTIRLKGILKKEKIDIIQVNDFYNLLGAAAKTTGFKGKLITYIRFLPSVMPSILRKFWIKVAIKRSHKVVCVSDAVKNQLPAVNTVVRIYDPVQLKEQLAPKEYDTAPSVINLLYLSNYISGKGQDDALDAFANACKLNRSLRLHFVGGDMGLEKNKTYRNSLMEKAQRAGLENVVTFSSFSANVEEVIKAADIMLNFSHAESFSMTCLEAAYYGTPIIATKCGGPEEIIVDKKTGLLVPVKDVESMAKAILLLAEEPELRAKYALEGKKFVRQQFSIQNFIHQFESILATDY